MTTNLLLIFVIRFSFIIIYYAVNYVSKCLLTAIACVYYLPICLVIMTVINFFHYLHVGILYVKFDL